MLQYSLEFPQIYQSKEPEFTWDSWSGCHHSGWGQSWQTSLNWWKMLCVMNDSWVSGDKDILVICEYSKSAKLNWGSAAPTRTSWTPPPWSAKNIHQQHLHLVGIQPPMGYHPVITNLATPPPHLNQIKMRCRDVWSTYWWSFTPSFQITLLSSFM